MGWNDKSEFTEPADGDSRPLLGVTGGDRARPGDTYTLTFEDNGEEVETKNGEAVAFDATFEGASFNPLTSDGEAPESGDPIRLMTSSARFLSGLADLMPVAGDTVEVTVEGTGYDAAYSFDAA